MDLWPWCRSSSEWTEEYTWCGSLRWEAMEDVVELEGKRTVEDMSSGPGMDMDMSLGSR